MRVNPVNDIVLYSKNAIYIDSRYKSSLSGLINYIAGDLAVIKVNHEITITESLTIPSNIILDFSKNGKFIVNDCVLTLQPKAIFSDRNNIFEGISGYDIVINSDIEIYTKWFYSFENIIKNLTNTPIGININGEIYILYEDQTIGENVRLNFMQGGKIITDETVTINTKNIKSESSESIFDGSGSFVFLDGMKLKASYFDSFEKAVDYIGNSKVELDIDEFNSTSSGTFVVGENIRLKFRDGITINNPNLVLWMYGYIDAGNYQIFENYDTLEIYNNDIINVKWFGDSNPLNQIIDEILKALIVNKITINIPYDTYTLTDKINVWLDNVKLVGNRSVLSAATDIGHLIYASGKSNLEINDLEINCNNVTGGIELINCDSCFVEKNFINGVATDGILLNGCSNIAIRDNKIAGDFDNNIIVTECNKVNVFNNEINGVLLSSKNGIISTPVISGSNNLISRQNSFNDLGYGIYSVSDIKIVSDNDFFKNIDINPLKLSGGYSHIYRPSFINSDRINVGGLRNYIILRDITSDSLYDIEIDVGGSCYMETPNPSRVLNNSTEYSNIVDLYLEPLLTDYEYSVEKIESSGSWVVPDGVYRVVFEVYGAGGGGAGGTDGQLALDLADVTSGADGTNTTITGPGITTTLTGYGGTGGYAPYSEIGGENKNLDGLPQVSGTGDAAAKFIPGGGAKGGCRMIPEIARIEPAAGDGCVIGIDGLNGGLAILQLDVTPTDTYTINIGGGGAGGEGKSEGSIYFYGQDGEDGFVIVKYFRKITL